MGIEEAVDQVEVPRSTAARARRQLSGQLRLRAGRERAGLLVADVDELQLAAAPADGVGDGVQAVPDDAVDAFDACFLQPRDQLVGNSMRHLYAPFWFTFRTIAPSAPVMRGRSPAEASSRGRRRHSRRSRTTLQTGNVRHDA